jgi:hypothetical protein
MAENSLKVKLDEGSKAFQFLKVLVPSTITAAATIVSVLISSYAVTKIIQKQTQVVIEPREGDIIVQDIDNSYKLLQLITREDVAFPSKLQEIQYSSSDKGNRVEVNKFSDEDWSDRDSFGYMINSFSINPNKIINLLPHIIEIKLYVDFYESKNISTLYNLKEEEKFFANIYDSNNCENFEISLENVESTSRYVTKEIDDGFEWAKIRLEINYRINNKIVIDRITSDWLYTDQDFIA